MTITWVPRNGGYWRNGHLVGEGDLIDETNEIICKGIFNALGQLDDPDGEVIDYSDSSNVTIRKGPFSNGSEDGTIIEYVFAKGQWVAFQNNPNGASSTRYSHTFSGGVYQSTEATDNNVDVKGNSSTTGSKFGNRTSFTFAEV